eukprot:2795782-Prymnesium_polylepis.1
MELEAFRAIAQKRSDVAINPPPSLPPPSVTASQSPSVADAFLATLHPPPAVHRGLFNPHLVCPAIWSLPVGDP